MPLQATSGAASYDAFGGGVPAVPNYIEDVFRTHLYSGDTGGYIFASSGVSIVSGGMMWVKSRGSATNNYIFSPSLTSANHYLNTNTTAAQSNSGVSNNNFEAVDNGGGMRFGGAFSGISSSATGPFTSWTFRKSPKFFDVVTYTGNGTNRTIAHNLGSAPGCVIIKCTSQAYVWAVYHRGMTSAAFAMQLQATDAQSSEPTYFNSTAPTSTVFSVGTANATNQSGQTYVAYVFAHNAGGFGLTGTDNVISCGSVANGFSGDVNLGYEVQWLMYKSVSTGGWVMLDMMRGMPNGGSATYLQANTADAEASAGGQPYPTATGFNITNGTGADLIYIAIRRGPMKVPTSGTSVLGLNARNGNGSYTTVTGGAGVTDFSIIKNRGAATNWVFASRLTANRYLSSNLTAAEVSASAAIFQPNPWDVMDGVKVGTGSSLTNQTENTYINYLFDRAPNFMDVVCYTGGITSNPSHNLGVTPEMYIVKCRSSGTSDRGWYVYHSGYDTANNYILMNSASGLASLAGVWSSGPTATTFGVANGYAVNDSGQTYVTYLFSTCAGVSKVGSYTGNGTTQTINCGFTTGARFVLVKRTDNTANWATSDTARGMVSGTNPALRVNLTNAESAADFFVTTSVGFQIVNSDPTINADGGTYIFLAIA